MKREEIEKKLLDMGFSAANKGFRYIVDALESIHKDSGEIVKISATYEEISRKRNVTAGAVERAIRYEIGRYYKWREIHPMLRNDAPGFVGYANREFLARLYRVIYEDAP